MNEFRKKIRQSRVIFSGIFHFPMSPRRHFRRLVLTMLALFLAVVGFHSYYFYRIQTHKVFQAADATVAPAPKVNEAKLTKVLSHYENKAIMRTQAAQLVPVVGEPDK